MASGMLARLTASGAPSSTRSLTRAFSALSQAQQATLAKQVCSSTQPHALSAPGGTRMLATVAAAAAAKTVPRKTAAAATTKKSTTARRTAKKAVAKKKKPVKKAAAKKPKKKIVKKKKAVVVLTPKEKIAKNVRELKKLLLKPPKSLSQTAWTVFVAKYNKTVPIDKTLSPRYRSLTPAEREHLNEEAIANKRTNETTLKQWMTSHSPETVWRSNQAGSRLRSLRRREKLNIHIQRSLKDDRQVKRPASAYAHFFQEKVGSGAMHGLKVADVAKLVSEEWKDLTTGDKQKFKDLAAAETLKYKRDVERVYGAVPTLRK